MVWRAAWVFLLMNCVSAQTPSASEQPRVIQLEDIRLPCPEVSDEGPRDIASAPESAVPEAVGVWVERCEVHRYQPDISAFVYDGRHVTLRYEPSVWRRTSSTPYLRVEDATFRLASRWEDDVLWARLPGGEWVEVARFVDGRFVRDERERVFEYVHEGWAPDSLFADRAPLDYEAEAHALRSEVLARGMMPAAIERCSIHAGVVPRGEQHVGSVEFTIGRDGCVAIAEVTHSHSELAACILEALQSTCLADYAYPAPTSYRYPLVVSPRFSPE